MRRTLLALIATLLALASPALAERGSKGDTEIGIFGGYGWLDDYGTANPKNHFLYGGRLGHFFSSKWSLEVSGQRLATQTDFEPVGPPNVDLHLTSYRFNALYNFAKHKPFRPFLTLGIGDEKTAIEGGESSSDFGWNAGAGFRWFMSPHWNFRVDDRFVSTKVGGGLEETEHNNEATFGLGVVFGGHKHHEAAVAPVNGAPTASLACERPALLPGESMNVNATATDPDGDPLTYAYGASAGRVTGAGATAAFDFTGVTPPSTSTITVSVSDNHGHTTTADCAVSLREPTRPAEAISCFAGGFPRNMSRLNNVDKACLDDMAQRLTADPRAHVIVIGHADGHERNAELIGQKRAQAVSDYVVLERGIEVSRVTVRSAAASKPLDAGTDVDAQARNRRVEVWFVPQGAKDPD
jgi:outer membrane protein OmpA-like peptidoglycan-associated protein